jgi:hypothetical protein
MRYTKYAFPMPDCKVVRVITDTDAKNEADDQYAIVHALLSPKFENVGFIAAHFGKRRTDSMEASYAELECIFDKMDFDKKGCIFRGAAHALENEKSPVDSEGARLIIEEAMKQDERPLYVTFLGPITDLASAYLLEPRIEKRLTAIWIGGGAYPAGGSEFNLGNDVNAANVVMKSNIELWQVPKPCYQLMSVSLAELEYKVRPCGKIGRYLFDQLVEHSQEPGPLASAFRSGEFWSLGDSPAVGLILFDHRFDFDWISAPEIGPNLAYNHTGLNRPIRVYRRVDPRFILEDLFAKLALFARNNPHSFN